MQLEENSIVIAPNPVHDKLTVQLPENNHYKNLKIFDLNGRIVLQKILPFSVTTSIVDVEFLKKGMYLLEIVGEDTQRHKFIKQ